MPLRGNAKGSGSMEVLAGSGVRSLAGAADHLPQVRHREQVVEWEDKFDGAGDPAAVKRLLRHVGTVPPRIPFAVRGLRSLEGPGSVALHGEPVVGAVCAQDRIRAAAGRVQRGHCDFRAADFDVFRHREHCSLLPARFMALPAGDRNAFCMGVAVWGCTAPLRFTPLIRLPPAASARRPGLHGPAPRGWPRPHFIDVRPNLHPWIVSREGGMKRPLI